MTFAGKDRTSSVSLENLYNISWPDMQFLFIFTSPYSGSTALARVLNTSRHSTLLHPKGEGNWLVPALSGKERWQSDFQPDWAEVRSIWSRKYHEVDNLVGGITTVIEKSPCNMVRFEQLLATFPYHASVVLNRDPYANVASMLYRLHKPDVMTDDERNDVVEELARFWLFRARWLRRICESTSAERISYEDFCADPKGSVDRIARMIPDLADADVDARISVKDYAPQTVQDFNAKQFAMLHDQDISAISRVLEGEREALDYWKYDLREA